MRFTVKFDSAFCSLQDQISINYPPLHKSSVFSYSLNKNQDLQQHIHNIHKSLKTIGVPITDSSTNFALQVLNLNGGHVVPDEVPMYLKACDPLELQIAKLADICKKSKVKGLILNLVLTPEMRAERAVKLLQTTSSNDQLKNVVFVLRNQFEDFRFLYKFVELNGFDFLTKVIDTTKGNSLSYTISAIAKAIENEDGLSAFLKLGDGIPKIYEKVRDPMISVCRSSLEVVSICCQSSNGWKKVHEYAVGEDDRYQSLLVLLKSEDLRTRLDAIRLLNNIIIGSAELKDEILQILKDKNVLELLQFSSWIKHSDIVDQIKLFEDVTGMKVPSREAPENSLSQKEMELNLSNSTISRSTDNLDISSMLEDDMSLSANINNDFESNQKENEEMIESLKDSIESLRQQNSQIILERDEKYNSFQNEIQSLQNIIAQLKEEIGTLKEFQQSINDDKEINKGNDNESCNHSVKNETGESNKESETLNNHISNGGMEEIKSSDKNINDDLDDEYEKFSRNLISDPKFKLEIQPENTVISTRDDNEAHNAANDQLVNSNNNIKSIEEDYSNNNDKIIEKNASHTDLDNSNNTKSVQSNKELKELKRSIKDLKSQISKIEEEKYQLFFESEKYKKENFHLREKNETLQTMLSKNEEKNEKLQIEVEKLKQSIIAAREEEEAKKLQKQREMEEEPYDALREKVNRMEKLVLSSMKQKQEMQKEIANLRSSLENRST